ncbi:MAG: tetratricopeptide repeat protein, partial [Firmicutes bacterium]|nr:tetratricopeptide repeat protein [Bacillota bacterium]
TVEIARRFGAQVVCVPWREDFSLVRNRSLDLAGGKWILCLDADEDLRSGDADELRRLIGTGCPSGEEGAEEGADGYLLSIFNYYGERSDEYSTDLACRLFRNRPEYRFTGRVHEQVAPSILGAGGRILVFPGPVAILHQGYRNRGGSRDRSRRNLRLLRLDVRDHPRDPYLHYALGVECLGSGRLVRARRELERSWRILIGDRETGSGGGSGSNRMGSSDPGLRKSGANEPGANEPGANVTRENNPGASKPENSGKVWPSHDPGYLSDLCLKLACCRQGLGDWRGALELLAGAQERYPGFTDLVFTEGMIWEELGRYEQAAGSYERCLSLGEAFPAYSSTCGVGSFQASYALGRCLEKTGRPEEALRAYALAVIENPGYPAPLHDLARLMAQTNGRETALSFLRERFTFRTSAALSVLLEVLFHLGARAEAWEVLAVLPEGGVPPVSRVSSFWEGMRRYSDGDLVEAGRVWASLSGQDGLGRRARACARAVRALSSEGTREMKSPRRVTNSTINSPLTGKIRALVRTAEDFLILAGVMRPWGGEPIRSTGGKPG